MSQGDFPVFLTETLSGDGVPANLVAQIGQQQISDWHDHWRPALEETLARMRAAGVPKAHWPQTAHWNWESKTKQIAGLLAYRSFAITSQGVTQGLMRVDLNHSARQATQVGKPLVYVEYLEVAPWNRAEFAKPRYRGVGTALLTAAVDLSLEEGFHGRIGLHSLTQAESFYRDACRMSDLGIDINYDNLRYFEMTSEQAAAFLG
jgi:hypothetical protein